MNKAIRILQQQRQTILQIHTYSLCTDSKVSKIYRPNVKRYPFKQLTIQDIEYFKSILPASSIITDAHDLEPYNNSILKTQRGLSQLALFPANTSQISQILQYCNNNKLAVVPQGGNTGLVGGNTPVYDQIILSMKNLNTIHKFDQLTSVITLDAGCVLEKANDYVRHYHCQFPLDLGAKGSCQVGGNAATAAGGIYMVKHGSYRSYILGLQAVMPSGQILNLLSQNQKDNTGYDIKNLLIGSQGTLGIITKLNILCPKFNPNRQILVFKTPNYSTIMHGVKTVKQTLGNQLNALQYMDGLTYQISCKHTKTQLMDRVLPHQHLLLVQTTCDNQRIEQLLQKMGEDFNDSIMSTNEQEFRKIWKVRESVALAAEKEGRTRAYDISYDIQYWAQFTRTLRQKMPHALVLSYGHIGDGNIHLNFCHPHAVTVDDAQMYKMVTERGGSISAEHGLGIQKNKYLHLQKQQPIIELFRQIKNVFDPNGIMNPYKMIPNPQQQ